MNIQFLEKLFSSNFFSSLLHDTYSPKNHTGLWERLRLDCLFDTYACMEKYQPGDPANYLARFLAKEITREIFTGVDKLEKNTLDEVIALWDERPYLFLPKSHSLIFDHIRNVLEKLRSDRQLIRKINLLTAPCANRLVEKRIKEAQGILWKESLTSKNIRMAVVSAALTLLRQKVGSCFATAPAIRIQQSHLKLFIEDMSSFIQRGKLTRIIEGKEYSMPICPHLAEGELHDWIDLTSLDMRFSPLLLHGLQCAGIISLKAPHLEAVKQCEELLSGVKKRFSRITLRDLFKEILLKAYAVQSHEYERFLNAQSESTRYHLSQKRDHRIEQFDECYRQVLHSVLSLHDHPLLRCWEYTLASFADYNVELSSWNLLASLGLKHTQKDGIGEKVYQSLHRKLEAKNAEAEKLHEEHQQSLDKVRYFESRLTNASSYEEIKHLKSALQMHRYHMYTTADIFEEEQSGAKMYATLYSFLMERYMESFSEYFQEIYDPNMFAELSAIFNDSPAGFRLAYKHGRSDPSLWTLIYTEKQYVDCLKLFFQAVEPQILAACPWDKAHREIESLTTLIIHHVGKEEFMQSAYQRMAAIQEEIERKRFSLQEKLGKKPWSHVSGGTINRLLKSYYQIPDQPHEETVFIESEENLCIFLIDLLKELPYTITQKSIKDPNESLLAYSPAHAFLIKPGYPEFCRAWEDRGFTYTYIRDYIIQPARNFYEKINLDHHAEMELAQFFFREHLNPKQADQAQKLVSNGLGSVDILNFRSLLINTLTTLDCKEAEMHVDGFLRKALPLIPVADMYSIANKAIGKQLDATEKFAEKILHQMPLFPYSYLPLHRFYDVLKAFCYLSAKNSSLPYNLDLHLQEQLRALGYFPPTGLRFGDSNWPYFIFTFLVNPATMQLQLWRTDSEGWQGYPMTQWHRDLKGASNKPWGVFTAPMQYSKDIK